MKVEMGFKFDINDLIAVAIIGDETAVEQLSFLGITIDATGQFVAQHDLKDITRCSVLEALHPTASNEEISYLDTIIEYAQSNDAMAIKQLEILGIDIRNSYDTKRRFDGLVNAVRNRNYTAVKIIYILDRPVLDNKLDELSESIACTLMCIAEENDDLDMIKLLLNLGVSGDVWLDMSYGPSIS